MLSPLLIISINFAIREVLIRDQRINPLETDSLYLACMSKMSIFSKEGIIEKISYERRAYESVDDRSHS